ncbi:MAG: TonB C-terminal protein [Chitinophagaceae bacterium]|nr:TonB C-terminal protein [Chitinophagaceae bacterium]
MTDSFEIQKNTKAISYTALICALLLAIAFLYKWRLQIPPMPAIQDLIEINLGNEQEGMGDVQPLVKGDPAPDVPQPQSLKSAAVHEEPSKDIQADENNDKDAAPVTKVIKPNKEAKVIAKETITKPRKTNNTVPVVNPNPAPPKPKIALYKGGNGNGGNGADQDNGYKSQGNKPGGNGDNGSPNGNPDSYGNSPGGKPGGPKVFGNRKIVRYYSFTGDLEKATIYAIVKVTPEGVGSFAGFAKNSSTTARAYANAIVDYLRNVKFDKADHESTVTVQFNFNIQ